MSQVQPLYREHPDNLEGTFQRDEASLLSKLFARNGRTDVVQAATPPGYGYIVEKASLAHTQVAADGPIMQIAAHPGDGPDFFYATYLQMAANTQYQNEMHEILLTDGERGVTGWNPERTRQARIEEAYAGAMIVGSRLHFLGFPDGGLSTLTKRMRNQLVTQLAALIRAIQPRLVVVHSPKNDHPDHAYSFLFAVMALERNIQIGGNAPTLLIHDTEFGLQQKSLWRPYKEDSYMHFYPMHSPEYIVDISSTHQSAQCALHKHRTQMYNHIDGQPKAYADLIDTLARIRGLQCISAKMGENPQGQGFSHIIIPGITSENNILPLRLPPGILYRRIKQRICTT